MKQFSKSMVLGTFVLIFAVVSLTGLAQDRGRRGDFDPEQMQQRMMERMQEVMGSTDEEWTVIHPLISDVMEKQRDARRGGFGFRMLFDRGDRGDRGNRGDGPGRRGFGPQPSPEEQTLQETLQNEDASATEIQAKLQAVRDARKQEQAELEKAQDKLRKVLTIRQEALLVMMGMLD